MPFDDPLLAGSRENNMVGQYWEMRKITQALPDPNTLLSYDLTKVGNLRMWDEAVFLRPAILPFFPFNFSHRLVVSQ